jgi:hypothetical protein
VVVVLRPEPSTTPLQDASLAKVRLQTQIDAMPASWKGYPYRRLVPLIGGLDEPLQRGLFANVPFHFFMPSAEGGRSISI